MSDHVHWMLELAVKDGGLDDFKALMREMVEATQANEPGALNYEWFVDGSGRTCHIYERYADSAATMVHLATFGEKFAGRFLALAQPTRLVVYGKPDATVVEALSALNAEFMTEIGGFQR